MSAPRSEREAEVRGFLAENFPLGTDAAALGRDESLLETGFIDSTGILELIGFLESRYGLEIPDDDLVAENFDTIASIEAYLDRRAPAAAS